MESDSSEESPTDGSAMTESESESVNQSEVMTESESESVNQLEIMTESEGEGERLLLPQGEDDGELTLELVGTGVVLEPELRDALPALRGPGRVSATAEAAQVRGRW